METRRVWWLILALLLGFAAVVSVSAGPAGTEISKPEAAAALQAPVAKLQADLAALADCVTVLEGTTPPPATYTLTLTTGGTGQGTVASTAPTYAAGAPVTLTATPASGSTFGGWSPAPCAPTFPMPAAPLTRLATSTASVTSPPTGAGWQRLPTGADAMSTFTFTSLTWDSRRNVAIATGWEETPWCFDGNTNKWATCGQAGPHHDFHNGGYAYDPHNDRHWVSTPQSTMLYWQRATGARVDHSQGGCGMDPAMIYDPTAKRLICFGGWSTPVGTPQVLTFALNPPATTWKYHRPATGPIFDDLYGVSKMTFTRAGWDGKRQVVWYVDEFLDYWVLAPATLTWTKHATTGTKPDKVAVFQRHEQADRIVAWVSLTGIVDSGEPTIRKTYALDPTTFVWTELGAPAAVARVPPRALPAATETVPPRSPSAQNMMIYDPVNVRLILHTGPNYGRETWALTLAPTTPKQFTLQLPHAGTGTGTTTGAGTYPAGTVISLRATPAAGSTFGGWSGDPDCDDGSVTMDGDKTCTATFTKAPVTGGLCLPRAAKAFTPCAVPSEHDASPFAAPVYEKDYMWTWDSTRQKV
jgi:hypothetical protein